MFLQSFEIALDIFRLNTEDNKTISSRQVVCVRLGWCRWFKTGFSRNAPFVDVGYAFSSFVATVAYSVGLSLKDAKETRQRFVFPRFIDSKVIYEDEADKRQREYTTHLYYGESLNKGIENELFQLILSLKSIIVSRIVFAMLFNLQL